MSYIIPLLVSLVTIGHISSEKFVKNDNIENKAEYCSKKDDGDLLCDNEVCIKEFI